MKKIFSLFLIGLLFTGIAHAKDLEFTKQAGPYSVIIKLDKNPPVTGNNGIAITIKDTAGKTVKDANAKVTIDYEMPAMPGMPAMRYKAQPVLKGDSYAGNLNFSMGGAWILNIKITRGEKTDTVKLSVDVS
jgi:hypothetical protein